MFYGIGPWCRAEAEAEAEEQLVLARAATSGLDSTAVSGRGHSGAAGGGVLRFREEGTVYFFTLSLAVRLQK